MKALVFLVLVCGAVYWWMSSDGKGGAPVAGRLFERQKVDPHAPVEITDLKGRSMSCRVVGKRASFVQIERTADQRRFVVDLKTLDVPSRQRLEVVNDFNAKEVNDGIYDLAKQTVKAELLYAPELCYYNCPINGQRMQSTEGYYLDDYRAIMRKRGIGYQEVVVKLTKVGGGFMLPPGIGDLPCVRVGEQVINQRDGTAIKEALIVEYLKR